MILHQEGKIFTFKGFPVALPDKLKIFKYFHKIK